MNSMSWKLATKNAALRRVKWQTTAPVAMQPTAVRTKKPRSGWSGSPTEVCFTGAEEQASCTSSTPR